MHDRFPHLRPPSKWTAKAAPGQPKLGSVRSEQELGASALGPDLRLHFFECVVEMIGKVLRAVAAPADTGFVRPLSRRFPPFGQASLSAQLRRPRPRSATGGLRRLRPSVALAPLHRPNILMDFLEEIERRAGVDRITRLGVPISGPRGVGNDRGGGFEGAASCIVRGRTGPLREAGGWGQRWGRKIATRRRCN